MKISKNEIIFDRKTVPFKTDEEWNHNVLHYVAMICEELSTALRHVNTVDDAWIDYTLDNGSVTGLSIQNMTGESVCIKLGDEIVEIADIKKLSEDFLKNIQDDLDTLLGGLSNSDVILEYASADIKNQLFRLEKRLSTYQPETVSSFV